MACTISSKASIYGAGAQGGYDLKALGESVGDSFRGLLGEASGDRFSPDLLREEPLDAVRAVLREARTIHGL